LWIWLILSALFVFFSFFTKQDAGALAFILCLVLLVYHALVERKLLPAAVFLGSFLAIGFLFIYPLTKYNFGYWFNHGQPPHTARVSVFDIVEDFFWGSQWIKFYLFIILLTGIARYRNWRSLVLDKKAGVFLLLTIGILAETAV